MEYNHTGVGTIVQCTMDTYTCSTWLSTWPFCIQSVHIYMHDTNIADGVEGEEIPRDTLVFVCRQ